MRLERVSDAITQLDNAMQKLDQTLTRVNDTLGGRENVPSELEASFDTLNARIDERHRIITGYTRAILKNLSAVSDRRLAEPRNDTQFADNYT